MSKRHLIQQQPLLREIFREPLIISYRKGCSFKDILMRENYTREENQIYYGAMWTH